MSRDQAPNRALILQDIRSWLGMITEANGYPITVRTVGDELKQADQMSKDLLPWVGVFTAPVQPGPVYFPFGRKEVLYDVVVVAHVRGANQAEKEAEVARLEQAIEEVLQIDPTRDGFAIDTVAAEAPDSDDAQPDKGGRVDWVTDLTIRYRCNFYPDAEARGRMAHGEIYRSGLATATVIGAGQVGAIQPFAGTTILGSAVLFDSPADGQLRYTGAKTRTMRLAGVGALYASVAMEVFVGISKNGTIIPSSVVSFNVSGAVEGVAFSVQHIGDLVESDVIKLEVLTLTQGSIYWINGTLEAIPVAYF